MTNKESDLQQNDQAALEDSSSMKTKTRSLTTELNVTHEAKKKRSQRLIRLRKVCPWLGGARKKRSRGTSHSLLSTDRKLLQHNSSSDATENSTSRKRQRSPSATQECSPPPSQRMCLPIIPLEAIGKD